MPGLIVFFAVLFGVLRFIAEAPKVALTLALIGLMMWGAGSCDTTPPTTNPPVAVETYHTPGVKVRTCNRVDGKWVCTERTNQ